MNIQKDSLLFFFVFYAPLVFLEYHKWDKKRHVALFIQNSRFPHQNDTKKKRH